MRCSVGSPNFMKRMFIPVITTDWNGVYPEPYYFSPCSQIAFLQNTLFVIFPSMTSSSKCCPFFTFSKAILYICFLSSTRATCTAHFILARLAGSTYITVPLFIYREPPWVTLTPPTGHSCDALYCAELSSNWLRCTSFRKERLDLENIIVSTERHFAVIVWRCINYWCYALSD